MNSQLFNNHLLEFIRNITLERRAGQDYVKNNAEDTEEAKDGTTLYCLSHACVASGTKSMEQRGTALQGTGAVAKAGPISVFLPLGVLNLQT